MITEVIPVFIVLLLLAAICVIAAERFWKKAEYGALAVMLVATGGYLLFPMDAIIGASKQIVGWASVLIFVLLVCFVLLSPRAYESWKGRHGCSSGTGI